MNVNQQNHSDSSEIQGFDGVFGQSFLPTANPKPANFFLDFRHTGSRKPILERSPKLHCQGQRGNRETQCWSKDCVKGCSRPPGKTHEIMLSAPAEPRVSDQLVTSRPRNGPSKIRNPSVLVFCVIGMMMAKRSTILEPSCRSMDHPASSARTRKTLIDCTGDTQTSKSCVARRTMMLPNVGSTSTLLWSD